MKAHQRLIGDAYPTAKSSVWMAAFRCDECGVLSVGALTSSYFDRRIAEQAFEGGSDIRWLPEHGVGKAYDDVPRHIADAASEAHRCDSIGAYRAAAVMARAVVEATAKDRGITKGRLVDKIDEMNQRGMIRELVKDQAHEVRYLGNDMAHGDFVDPVTAEESAETLELMAEVLREVYQAPARLKARKDARLAKRKPDAG